MSSADNFCKQFGPRPGQIKHLARSGSKLFDTLIVFLKEFFEKVDFEKNHQAKKAGKFPQGAKSSWFLKFTSLKRKVRCVNNIT